MCFDQKVGMHALNGLIQWSLLLLLIVAKEANPEILKNDPKACTTITKAADRLACFDRAFAKSSLSAPASIDLRALVSKDRQCDLQALHAAIAKSVPPKSDYETEAAFVERGRKQLEAAGVPTFGIFCRTNNIMSQYDAERGGYKIDGMFPRKSIYTQEGKRRVYTFWNGDYQLAMNPVATIPVAVAEKLGEDVTEGAILDLVSPFSSQYRTEESVSSTKDDPESSVAVTLYFEPRYVFLYNSATFEVLWSRPVLRCNSSGHVFYMVDACSQGTKRLN